MIKVLRYIAYISGGIGAILILFGVVSVITLKHKLDAIYIASYFLAANTFMLITIIILLSIHLYQHKKD